MKSKILKLLISIFFIGSGGTLLSGCVGSNIATSKVLQFNVEVVDNKYARGGVNVLLTPVYALTMTVDLLFFNSVEFWMGESPLNGEKHIFDSESAPYYLVKDSEKTIHSIQAVKVNEHSVDYEIVYTSGEVATLRGDKLGEVVYFYLDGELVASTPIQDLTSYVQP